MAKSKRSSLQAVLDVETAAPADVTQQEQTTPKKAKEGRAGKHLIGGHFPEPVLKQLRIIAAEENTTTQNLLGEALNDLFVKRGKKQLDV